MASNWDTRTQACWPIALFFSFKLIGSYSAVQTPYWRPQYCSILPLLFDPDSYSRKFKVCILIFYNTRHLHRICSTFPSLYHISCIRISLLSSSCAAYNADWHAQLGALPTFCNVSCPVYLWTKHTYRLVPPEIIGWSHTFHRLPITVFFFISNSLFWIKSAQG